MNKKYVVLILLIVVIINGCGIFSKSVKKNTSENQNDTLKYVNWLNKDFEIDKIPGVSTERAYQFLKDKKSVTVLVAVIDGGIDVKHEDLKNKIWVNDDIPGNNIDEDKNGFVDDVNGWNFLGNNKGEVIEFENIEDTRIYREFKDKYENITIDKVPENEKSQFELYKIAEKTYKDQLKETTDNLENMQNFISNYEAADLTIKNTLNKQTYTLKEVKDIKPATDFVTNAKDYIIFVLEKEIEVGKIIEYKDHLKNMLEYNLNINWNPRSKIIGDNPSNNDMKIYGTSNVNFRADHGTFVAGVIGGERNNGIGMNGIANNVKIMSVVVVPDGDERDKDVSNGIHYAVDNGAKIINMSFGKTYSPQKFMVDEAVKYAENHGVLLVHASGNEAANNDTVIGYPLKKYLDGTTNNRWISVGASSIENNENLAGSFSNYGKTTVDLFAPGVSIYSTSPGSIYKTEDGTSFSSPVVTGVAALLMSYYPELSVDEIKTIILNSVTKFDNLSVNTPNESGDNIKKVPFSELSVTGGIVNAYNAVLLAEKIMSEKKK